MGSAPSGVAPFFCPKDSKNGLASIHGVRRPCFGPGHHCGVFKRPMKTLRLTLYFVVGFLLSAVAVFSHAETIPATPSPAYSAQFKYQLGTCVKTSQTDLDQYNAWVICPFIGAPIYGGSMCDNAPACGGAGGGVSETRVCLNGGTLNGTTCYGPPPTCPTGQNWTLSGSNCTRPDCASPEVRNASTGVCEAPPNRCAGRDSRPPAFKWFSYDKGFEPWGYRCEDGCQTAQMGPVSHPTLNPDMETYVGGTHDKHALGKIQYYALECTAGSGGTGGPGSDPASAPPSETPVDPTKAPPPVKKPPVCAPTEGVLTTSSGTIACVPEGTVEARKPVVSKEKKAETFPDGTVKTTDTTKTVDPATGAFDIKVSSTATAKSDGTAGQAGPVGTSSGSTTSGGTDGNGDGDGDGSCDPSLNFCGGPGTEGLYTKKDKTVASVVGDFSNGVKTSPAGSAMTGFFNIGSHSGGCPNWVVNVAFLNVTLDIGQYFCTSTAQTMMQLVGAVLLAVASFVGFRWAIL